MLNTSLRVWFKKEKCPIWSCPACGRPELSIKEGSFRKSQTLTSGKSNSTIGAGIRQMTSLFILASWNVKILYVGKSSPAVAKGLRIMNTILI